MARLIAFAVTVYLARRLGASGYGVIAFATAIMLYFTYVADAGLDMLGVRDVAEDRSRIATLVPSIVTARLLLVAGLASLLLVAGLVVLPQPEGAVVAAYGFGLVAVAGGTRWALIGLEQSGLVAVARIAGEGTVAVLMLALVRGSGDLVRVPALQLGGDALAALLMLWFLGRGGARLAATRLWRPALPVFRRSWPLVAHALLGLLIFNSDFFFLRAVRDSATVGLYAAAYTLISFVVNLGVAYGMSLLPAIMRTSGDPREERDLYETSFAHVTTGALPVALGGTMVAPALMAFVFGAEYLSAAAPLRILLWALPVSLVRNVAQAALIAKGRQGQVLATAGWAAVLNVALNLALIPPLGMIGAAASTLATETLRTALSLGYGRAVGVPVRLPVRLWRPAVAVAAMAAAVTPLRHSLVLAVAVGAVTYVLALAVTGGLRLRRGGVPELTV